MGRRPRMWYPGAVYLITNRGNGRANIFVEGDDRRMFLNKLAALMKEHGIKLYGTVGARARAVPGTWEGMEVDGR